MINLNPLIALSQNQYVRYAITLFVGITIGALFYPTKRVEERVSQKYEQQIKTLNESHSKEMQASHEQLDKATAQSKSYKKTTQVTINKLTTQVQSLKSSKKTNYYKIVHPDGTVEVRSSSDSESDAENKVVTQVQQEYQQKVDEVEKKWSKIHQDRVAVLSKEYTSKAENYERIISELKKEKITETNMKKFGVEGGLLSDKDYYVHVTGDLWGPIFLGFQGETGQHDSKLGLGLGIRF